MIACVGHIDFFLWGGGGAPSPPPPLTTHLKDNMRIHIILKRNTFHYRKKPTYIAAMNGEAFVLHHWFIVTTNGQDFMNKKLPVVASVLNRVFLHILIYQIWYHKYQL